MLDKVEDEEKRRAEAIRAERLQRRAEGIPVHMLSATASDFRTQASAADASIGRAPTAHAPHGGAISEEIMSELELSREEQVFVARALHVAGVKFGWLTKVLG